MIIRVKRSVISYQAGSGLNLNLAWTITQLLTLLKHTLDRSKNVNTWIFSLSFIKGKRKRRDKWRLGPPFLWSYYVSRFCQSLQVLGRGGKARSTFLIPQRVTFPWQVSFYFTVSFQSFWHLWRKMTLFLTAEKWTLIQDDLKTSSSQCK